MSIITQLAALKGGATLENLQKLVDQEIDNQKLGIFLKRVSWIISEILVGPPSGKCMDEEQKSIYDTCIDSARECWLTKNCENLRKFKFEDDQILELKGML
jgi:hypothetical protein